MENKVQSEQPKSERTIQLGEEFHPFDPNHTTQKPQERLFRRFYTRKEYTSQVSLNLNEDGEKLPFQIDTIDLSRNRLFAMLVV